MADASTDSLHSIPPLTEPRELRQHMPIVESGLYLDHAAVGVLPQPVADAMLERIQSGMRDGVRHWNRWQKMVQRTRRLAAELIGATADEVAFVPNTATGIGTVAEGFRWKAGDNVVLSSSEFPSNRFPWLNLQRRGVEVRLVETPESTEGFAAAIDSACDQHTRIVACSWVDYMTGVRRDPAQLAAIAHRHGALLAMDAIQGLGVLAVDLHAQGIDVLVADSRKWMLAPEGAGILAIRQEHQELIEVTRTGWASSIAPMEFGAPLLELSQAASRFESGMQNTYGLAGLYASLKLLQGITPSAREHALLETRGVFEQVIRSAGLQTRNLPLNEQSGIITCRHPQQDSKSIIKRLRQHDVVVSLKGDSIRVSPHIYNTADDAQRFAEALAGE